MNYYTYLYTDPSRNEPIYVGKGKGRRAKSHLTRYENHPFYDRLRKMKREGIEPIITFLCKDVDEELAYLCEIMAIEKYGRKDLGKGTLLNLSDGGEGGASGRIASKEERDRRSAKTKDIWRRDGFRDQMREAQKLAQNTPEAIANKSASSTKNWQDPEFKANTGAAITQSKNRPCSYLGIDYPSQKAARTATGHTHYRMTKCPTFRWRSPE